MSKTLKIEVAIDDLDPNGIIASEFPTKDYVDGELAKRVSLGDDGKIVASQLPDYDLIAGLPEKFEDVADDIVASAAQSVNDSKAYTDNKLSTELAKKADLVEGKVPQQQLPYPVNFEQNIANEFTEVRQEIDAGNQTLMQAIGTSESNTKIYVDGKVNEQREYIDNTFSEFEQQVNAQVNDFDTRLDASETAIVHYNKGEIPLYEPSLAPYKKGSRLLVNSGVEYVNNVDNNTANPNINTTGWSSKIYHTSQIDYKWKSKADGYALNERVMLDDGGIVQSTVENNITNPNIDMTGWVIIFSIKLSNSIVDLLNISNPKDGQTVNVVSFHEGQNEGGDLFIFKSDRKLENDGVSIFNGWERQKNGMPWTPEDAGARHDGVTDDAPCFVKLFKLAKIKPIVISCRHGVSYIIDTDILVENIYSVLFMGNGATYKITNSSNRNVMYPFTLTGIEGANTCLFVDNFKQDGSAAYVDQSTITRELYICGFRLWNMSVFMRGIQQDKLQGYAFQFLRCKNVVVDGYIGNDVGGNNSNGGMDSMGDIFYIGDRVGESNYEFKNVMVNGVVQGGLASRALVVCEVLVPSNNVDTITNVTLTNVTAKHFMRALHNETAHGSISITVNNSDIRDTSVFALAVGVGGGCKVDINNSHVELNNFQYGGTNTMNFGCEVNINAGTVIDGVNSPSAILIQNTSLGKTRVNNGAKIKNIKGLLGVNGEIVGNNADFEFLESYTSYYLYNSHAELESCNLFNKESTSIKSIGIDANDFRLKGCEVRNLSFDRSVYGNSASNIYMNTSLTGYNRKLVEARFANIYLNNVLYSKFGQTQSIKYTSQFSSCDDLVFEGAYYIEGVALTNAPAVGFAGLVETKLMDYLPEFENSLLQISTDFVTKAVKRRTRNYQGTWSNWS